MRNGFYPYNPSHAQDPYFTDPYYSEMQNASAGPSRNTAGLYPAIDPPRKRPGDGLPAKPTRQHSSSNTSRDFDNSPPRKTARPNEGRTPLPRRSSGANEWRGNAQDSRDRERLPPPPTPRSAPLPPPPKLEPVIHAFVEAFKAQQDARKERIDVETNNAKYLKYRDRDDISKENKAKADKAADEIKEARRKDESAWTNVEKQTKEMLAVAIRQQEGGASRSGLMTLRSVTPPRRVATPVPSAESDLEPGEIAVSTTSAAQSKRPQGQAHPSSPGPPPVPSVSGPTSGAAAAAAAAASTADKVADETLTDQVKDKKSTVTRASILEKFKGVDLSILEVKSDTEDRLNQMESDMEDRIRLEVESRIRKARMASKANATQAAEETNGVTAAVGDKGKQPQSKEVPTAPVPSNINGMPTTSSIAGSSSNGIRHTRDEPGMTHEQVTALVESVRQSMRQEFDTKLHAQQQEYQNLITGLHHQVAAQFRSDQESLKNGLNAHREVLHNHQTLLTRHDQLWHGTLGVFANVPKPTNTP
jgi:hypothetical protein